MNKATMILGKGGVGKTFLATHLARAFDALGVPTLLVGADAKPDARRALTPEARPSLMEALEQRGFDYARVAPADVLAPVTERLDVLELGPSPLLVGYYGAVLEEAFHWFRAHDLTGRYHHVLFDVTDERFDETLSPLFRRVHAAVAVSDGSAESLFVVNRLLRAAQIGAYELGYPLVLLGVVQSLSRDPQAFQRYVERTRVFPLLTVPDSGELAHLRAHHRTLFDLKRPPAGLQEVQHGLIKLAEMLRGEPMNLYPVMALPDEEVWPLATSVARPG